jgi:hypothetical protein
MWLVDPLEWQHHMALARALLPELSFSRDGEAALLASRLGGLSVDALAVFDWSRPAVYMPPFRSLVEGASVSVAVEGFTARRLAEAGVRPDVVVTDLDYEPASVGLGSVVVVHAHGDNVDLLPLYRPPRRVYTVQVPPPPGTYNVGGFTDGDRAAHLAYAMGAREIAISGFYPDVPIKRRDSVKARKLALAGALLARLSRVVPIRFL